MYFKLIRTFSDNPMPLFVFYANSEDEGKLLANVLFGYFECIENEQVDVILSTKEEYEQFISYCREKELELEQELLNA